MDNKGGYDEGLEGVEPERAKPTAFVAAIEEKP